MSLQATVDAWTSRYIRSKEASLARLVGALSRPISEYAVVSLSWRPQSQLQSGTERRLGWINSTSGCDWVTVRWAS